MILNDVKAIFTGPGLYCLTYRRRGGCVSRLVTVWEIWGERECEQVRGGQDVAILVTSEESILLSDVVRIKPYGIDPQDTATRHASQQDKRAISAR